MRVCSSSSPAELCSPARPHPNFHLDCFSSINWGTRSLDPPLSKPRPLNPRSKTSHTQCETFFLALTAPVRTQVHGVRCFELLFEVSHIYSLFWMEGKGGSSGIKVRCPGPKRNTWLTERIYIINNIFLVPGEVKVISPDSVHSVSCSYGEQPGAPLLETLGAASCLGFSFSLSVASMQSAA